jgi:hypothetical protein
MQSLLMVLALPPLLLLATMYNGWKFRSFGRERHLVKFLAAHRALERCEQRGKGKR